MENNIISLSLLELSQLIKEGKASPVDVTRKLLERIKKLDPILNTYVTLNEKQVMSEAIHKEQEIKKGFIKDLYMECQLV